MDDSIEKLIIVGAGPAGLCAAIYAARGSLNPLVITGPMPGGTPMIATEVEDYPGFPEGVKAPQLAMSFLKQAERFGARIVHESAKSVDFSKKPFEITTDQKTYFAKSIIIASGSEPLWLNIPSEKKLIGRGISACAVCDGPFFKDKKVAVIGGGDAALKEAIYLAKICSEVTVIHRRDALRAQEALQELAKSKENIKFLFNFEVVEFLGEEKLKGLTIKNNKTNEEVELNIDGVFVAVGHKPATEFLKGQIELDEKGYVIVKDETATSIEGVFAAGDVADPRYRQISTAVGSGAKAALDVEEYLDNLKA